MAKWEMGGTAAPGVSSAAAKGMPKPPKKAFQIYLDLMLQVGPECTA
jgi:hypothetical protein